MDQNFITVKENSWNCKRIQCL